MNATLSFLRSRWADLAFLALALAILGWVAWDAVAFRLITYSPGADYWEHTAVLRALLDDPFHPSHPLIESTASSPRFGPHFLLVALVGRALGTDALGAMSIAAIFNTLLFLAGIYAFFREYFRDPRAPLFGLVVMFGSWLDAPHFSNVYKLSVYFSVAGYPSSAALAIMLLALTALLRLLRSERERPGLWVLVVFLGAYLYVTHPLTAMLAFTAAGLLALTEPRVVLARRLWASGAVAAGLLLASLWPYYPALGMVASGTADRVQKGLAAGAEHALHPFYERERLVNILGLGLLAVPFFPYFVWRRKHLIVPLGSLAMLGVFGVSALLDIPLGHRFALLAVFFLQIGLVWLLLAALDRPWRAASEPALRYAARLGGALAAVGLLLFMVFSNVADARARFERERRDDESPTVRYARRVAELAGPNAVILAEPLASWPLPTFGPKIVTLHHRNPLILDGAERDEASQRFFAARTPESERRAILERFHVTHVIVTPKNSPSAQRFLEANGVRRGLPFGRQLFRIEERETPEP
ncbi:MAG TPA: hypothetical protein VMS65_07650 [Polyangiaceae bacterium]|nr:hypothetical protein [Polyangiaceae bacterium]